MNLKTAAATGVGLGAALLISYYTARLLTRSKKRKITKVIETIQEFHKKTVHIKDPKRVEYLVCQLIKGGKQKLQVISDFDDTMTRSHVNGKRCQTSYAVIEQTPYASEVTKQKLNSLRDLYYPIEHDPHMTIEEKIPLMIQWWSSANALTAQNRFAKTELAKIVRESHVRLRDGCKIFMELLRENDIPILVFSAGLGDVIEEILKQQSEVSPNVRLVSNRFSFDESGRTDGMKGELIHTYNKKPSLIPGGTDAFDGQRTNLILLGDTLGDLGMVEGLDFAENVLKIGYLNTLVVEKLSDYMNKYDIVLTNDQTMDLVNGLLKKIL